MDQLDENLFERAIEALLESGLTHDDALDMTLDAFAIPGVSL